MEKLGINLGYLLVQIIHFAIVFVVLRAWVYKPVLDVLEKRRLAIAQGLEDARIAADARKNAETEAQKIIAEAQKRSAEIVNEATEKADLAARDIKVQAENDAMKVRENGLVEIGNERERMLRDLRGQVGAISVAAANKIIGETLADNPQKQHAIISQFFTDVHNRGEFSQLTGVGGPIEVVSAIPLDEQEQQKVRNEILSSAQSSDVHFKVDPSLLGGLIVKVGDRVLDGSVSRQLQDLKSTVN